MTEKRFKFNGENNCIECDGKSILLDIYGEDVEELLNKLNEENEKLREINKWLWKKIKEIDPPQEVPITWK